MNILDYVVDKLCRSIYGYGVVIEIFNKNESIIDLCGNRKKISDHGLKLEPILTLLKRFRR